MPWCPKCKMEYKNESTICPDCGINLVREKQEDASFVPVIKLQEEGLARKFIDFLAYSHIEPTLLQFNQEEQMYVVSVTEPYQKEAIKLYDALLMTEKKKGANETLDMKSSSYNETIEEKRDINSPKQFLEGTDRENPRYAPSCTYIKKEDKYKDLQSTGYTFLVFGFLGLIFVILNVIGILSIFNGILVYLVSSAMFLIFIYIGMTTLMKAKQIVGQIDQETTLTKEIQQHLKQTITKQLLEQIQDKQVSDEINFFSSLEYIKSIITEKFGIMDSAYLDQVAEDYYNEYLDQ